MNEAALIGVGYGLGADIGPIIDNSPAHVNQFSNVATSGGALTISSMQYVEFTAVSTVPIPAAVWLFGSALLGMVGIRRTRDAV